MLKGTVKFRARIVDTERGLTISQTCGINPNKPGVGTVEIECAEGIEIVITVYFTFVDNETLGIAIATDSK